MTTVTRGQLLKKTSMSAAALGAALVAPRLVSAETLGRAAGVALPDADMHESVLAYVRDARKGELTLWVGTREIIVRDAALVRRLVAAAR